MSLEERSEVKLKEILDFCISVVGTIPVVWVFPKEKRKLVPETARVIERELLTLIPVWKKVFTSFLGAFQGTYWR